MTETKSITLLYHDVVPAGRMDTSGFPGGDASIYKLDVSEFRRHLEAIHSSISPSGPRALLTFDDGGSSAHEYIASILEEFDRRGHFFVTTNWIGKPGFLSPDQIRNLRARGHSIGSHSCSHPSRMSYCSLDELRREWRNSLNVLSDILGERVISASVPGGYFARNVAVTAAEAGIQTLFTSEPITGIHSINGCRIFGRFTIQQGVTAATAAALARGDVLPRCRQYAYWNLKKLAKTLGGTQWLRMRKWVLAR
jgi:peptidoglycan/xylan/chitin deacetylase (PgdA/CDA1 family)